VDGEFVGYSTGDPRVPFQIEDLSPGAHTLRIHLSGFGVVKEPEITFHDWEEEVQIAPGKRTVVRSRSQSFNHIIYNLQQLVREDINFRELEGGEPVRREHDASFVGRDGKPVPITLVATARRQGDRLEYLVEIDYDGKSYGWDLSGPIDEKKEIRERVGKVEVRLEVDSWDVSYAIWRKDIEQGMQRNQ
jgi:hypothetical protein